MAALESEAISSVKIAILLMITSILVFIIITLVNVVKPYIFDTITGVVNVTEEEKTKQFDDYDGKWVSGSKLLRALKLYENTGFGIIYGTAKTQPIGSDYAVNFGGIFQGAGTYANGYKVTNFAAWKTKSKANDTFYTKDFQKDAAGNVLRFENKDVTRRSTAEPEYIPPDGRFYAELVRDKTGDIIGICFTQE